MPWPLSQDYNEAIQTPTQCFADPELRQGEAVINALGLPVPCSGNFADVYAVVAGQRKWAVKCFTRQIPGLQERYQQISRHLEKGKPSFIVDFTFLDRGIEVNGNWYPILKMQWVEGLTLNEFVRNNLDKPQVLDSLCQLWVKLAVRLREANIAHCDLQHGNLLLVPGKAGSLHVRLVDYDGMCVPALTLLKSIEVGHPSYQHPQRLREGIYSLEVDRFSHLVIYMALRALIVGGKPLWDRYDNGENLLFQQTDFAAPAKSRLFYDLLKLDDPGVRFLAEQMIDALRKPLDQTPLLEDLVGATQPARPVAVPQASAKRKTFVPTARPVDAFATDQKRGATPKRKGLRWLGAACLVGLLGLVAGAVLVARRQGVEKQPGQGGPVAMATRKNPETKAIKSNLVPQPAPAPKTEPEPKPAESGAEVVTGPKGAPETQPSALPPRFTNKLGMEFALVGKGTSWLGGGRGKPGDKQVEIPHDFYLGVYEVTQEEWQKVMGNNPSYFSRTSGGKEPDPSRFTPGRFPGAGKDLVNGIPDADLMRFPVENVSWDDAQLFLSRLNGQLQEVDWAYGLPTEVEWEYACRGGPMTDKSESAFDYYFEKPSNQLLPGQANFGQGLKRTCKVGSYPPNRLGLHDMHGNVWEWCHDVYVGANGLRVVHGGLWNGGSSMCRAAQRTGMPQSSRSNSLGLRLARVSVCKMAARFTNSLAMEFALVPKGTAWLGGGSGKPGDKKVQIPHNFYLGVYEVTQGEWQAVTGFNASQSFRKSVGEDRLKDISDSELQRFPMNTVSWDDAQSFLTTLNAQQKERGWLYRLPTEAEWEYACRGGPSADNLDSASDFSFDKPTNQLQPGQANFKHDKSLNRPCKVGSYAPNRLGIYDMHGNVQEWCQDSEGVARAVRGGGWSSGAITCRAAFRNWYAPSTRANDLGLRLALVPFTETPQPVASPIPPPSAEVTKPNLPSVDKWEDLLRFSGYSGNNRGFKLGLSPDGNLGIVLAGKGKDEGAVILDLRTGNELHRLEGESCLGAQFSLDGKYACTYSHNRQQRRELRLWDVSTGKELRRMDCAVRVECASFSPGGRELLTGGAGFYKKMENFPSFVQLWDVQSGRELKRFPVGGAVVKSIAFSSDGKYAFAGSHPHIGSNTNVWIWDTGRGVLLRQFTVDSVDRYNVAFSPDGKHYATAPWNEGDLKLWDSTTGRLLRPLDVQLQRLANVAFVSSGQYVMAGSWSDGSLRKWQVETGKQVHRFTLPMFLNSRFVAFSADGTKAFFCAMDGAIFLWNLRMAETVYLSDTAEFEVSAGEFAKKGNSNKMRVNGSPVPNGILLHPAIGGAPATVSYRLAKGFRTFASGVAIADNPNNGSAVPLTFVVVGDGKVLWSSKPVQKCRDIQFCSVNVRDVEKLALRVESGQYVNSWAHASWIEPQVLKELPPAGQ